MKRSQTVMVLLLSLGFLVSTAGGCAVPTSQPPATAVAESTVTPTAAPPTPTQTSSPMIQPVDPQGLHIAYVCNDGFIIVVDGKKILIDALFHDTNSFCREDSDETARSARSPFDNADLVLVSHSHWDHFDPQIVSDYMQNNPTAVLVAEGSVVDALRENSASFALIQERVTRVELERRQSATLSFPGIDIEIISAPADVPNLGFLVQVGQFTFFHSGDAGLDQATARDFEAYQLCSKNIDFAFLPYWFLMDPLGETLMEQICAVSYIPMHSAGENLDMLYDGFKAADPRTILFYEEWQIWSP